MMLSGVCRLSSSVTPQGRLVEFCPVRATPCFFLNVEFEIPHLKSAAWDGFTPPTPSPRLLCDSNVVVVFIQSCGYKTK